MKKLAYPSLIALFALGQGALACTSEVKTISAGKLTVAAYDYPPFSTVEANGSVSGIDPSIVSQIAAENCLAVVFNTMEPAATIQSVVTGKADVAIGSWNRTKARAQILGISAPTYNDPVALISKGGFTKVSQTEGKVAGTIIGYLWVDELREIFGDNLKLYPNSVALSQDLQLGRIDVAYEAYNYAADKKALGAYGDATVHLMEPDQRVTASTILPQASLLYTLGNDSLGAALDAGLAKLHEDGTIKKLITEAGFDAAVAEVGEPHLLD